MGVGVGEGGQLDFCFESQYYLQKIKFIRTIDTTGLNGSLLSMNNNIPLPKH